MTDKATHTPLPWRAGDFEVFGADDSVVCTVHWRSGDDCHQGNLETIVYAVNSHHDLIEALREADVDLVGAEMLLQNKSINATGALADTGWKPGREHIEGMQRTINQALAEIASARAILTKAEAGHG